MRILGAVLIGLAAALLASLLNGVIRSALRVEIVRPSFRSGVLWQVCDGLIWLGFWAALFWAWGGV